MQIIQSLGEAMAWFERELSWDVPLFDEIVHEQNLTKALKKAQKIETAIDSIIPVVFPHHDKPLQIGWSAAKVAWDTWAANNAAATVKFLINTLLKRDINKQNVSRFQAAKYICHTLQKTDNFRHTLDRILTKTELRALGLF